MEAESAPDSNMSIDSQVDKDGESKGERERAQKSYGEREIGH